jgi:hypothetical protein
MEFSITALSPETAKAGCVVVGVHSAKELTPPAKRIDQASRGALRNALPDLQEKTGSTLLLRGPQLRRPHRLQLALPIEPLPGQPLRQFRQPQWHGQGCRRGFPEGDCPVS